MLSIVNNASSLIAQGALNQTQSSLTTSLQRLSTGLKINSGADNPAGLVISEEQRAQINGLQSAITNTSKAVNVVQTAEGALNEVNSLLDQIRGLAVDSANLGVNDAPALAANQAQINNALATINSIAGQTQFGQKHLLDGTVGQQFTTLSGNQNISSVTGGPNTVAGTYTLNITQAGIKGQATAGSNFTNFAQTVGITAGAATINGSVSASPTTQAGNYTVSYAQQGIRANVTGGAFAAPTLNETLTVTGAFNATLNLTAGHTLAQSISDINSQLQAQGITNFVAQDGGGKLQLVSRTYGAAPAITVTSNLNGNGSGFGTVATVGQAGQALVVSVNGSPSITASGATGNFVNITSGVGAGVSFTAAETAPAVAGSLSLNTVGGSVGNLSATIQVTGSETLTLNGVGIQLNSQNANTITNAINTINSYSGQTGVTASNNAGKLQFTANAYGGNINAVESGDYGNVAQFSIGIGNSPLTANGQSLLATITDQNGNVSSTITGSGTGGNQIVGTSGNATGLTFNVAGSAISSIQSVAAGSTAKVTLNDGLVFQIGANFGQTTSISINQVSTSTIGQNVSGLNNSATTSLAKIDVTDPTGKNAQDAIKVVDQAISDISTLRGRLGAFQTNTLQANSVNLQAQLQNTQSAESTIRDTDFAAETANFTKYQVLLQAGTQVLQNANQTTQLVLGLIPRG
jgi:flagellin